MEQELTSLIEQLDRDEPEIREQKLNYITQPLWIVSGFLHVRDALRKLAGESYRSDYLETTIQVGDDGFPGIYALRVLDGEQVWHRNHDDPRFQSDADDPLDIIDALHPINARCHSGSYYGTIKRRTEFNFEGEMEEKFLDEQKLAITKYLQEEFWFHARKLNDGSRRYLDHQSFLNAGIHIARFAMEGIFANQQAKIDTMEMCRTANRFIWGDKPRVVEEFVTQMIRNVYGLIVSQQVPGEERPYDFRYVDRKFLTSLKS